MKELDFEELDKAVSSLMGKLPSAPKDPVVQPTQEPEVEELAQVLTATEPVVAAKAAEQEPLTEPAPSFPVAPVEPLAAAPMPLNPERRSGRFMDVVHPSSDMSTASMGSPSTASRPRMGVRLSPLNADIDMDREAPVEPSSTVPEPSAEKFDEIENNFEMNSVEDAQPQQWPDPLDQSAEVPVSNEPASVQVPANQVADDQPGPVEGLPGAEPVVEELTAEDTPAVGEEPSQTPFLANPKVDKRPLNAQVSADVEQLLTNSTEQLTVPIETQESKSIATPPPELNKELIAIESSDATSALEAPLEQQSAANVPIATSSSIASSSIYQQYKEKPSTGDQSHAAIYDTADVATPLSHPARKKSGWLIVLGVVMLLALGVGGAAYLYFSGIIG